MTCPTCRRHLSLEEMENQICVVCEHNMEGVTAQQQLDAKEAIEYRHYETEPLSNCIYSI